MLTLEQNVTDILKEIGEDTTREGLVETPKRYLKFLREFTTKPEFNFTTFDSEGYDEMIVEANIPFYSLCEHHMLPFYGFATVAYIPGKRIAGLSKLARTVDYFAHGLQNQERITKEVAAFLQDKLDPQGVAVVLRAQHMCMTMRGVQKFDTWTTTSRLLGQFRTNADCRNEFLQLIRKGE